MPAAALQCFRFIGSRRVLGAAALALSVAVCLAAHAPAALAAHTPAAPTLRDGLAELDSGRIYYRDSSAPRSNAPVVVFMHAGSGNSLLFEKQFEPFWRAGFRVIAYDRAGQGRSTRAAQTPRAANVGGPSDSGPTTARGKPELEQLMDHLQVQRFHLVGVAAGGGVSVEFTLERPERVRSLVLANSIGNVQDPSYVALGQRIRPPAFNQLPLEMRELGPSYRAADEAGVKRWLELSTSGQLGPAALGAPPGGAREGGIPPPGGLREGGPPRAGGPPPGRVAVTFDALSKMTVPVLLLTGDADLYTPPSVLRLFKQRMPKAELSIITESGHAAMWENPDAFNTRVLKFLRKH